MVDEYVAWYDRHHDPAWQDVAPGAARRRRRAHAVGLLRAADVRRPARDGTELLRHDLPDRGQHDPHAGVRSPHRARHSRRRPAAQGVAASRSPAPSAYREADRAHRPLPHVLRGRGHHRLSAPPGSRRAGGAAGRARDRRRARAARQGGHAHEPRLRRGRVHRQPLGGRSRRSSRHVRGGGERARRDRRLPQGVGAPREPVPGSAEQPVRRARRTDVARRRARAVGPRVPHRGVARARSPRGSSGISSTPGWPRPSSRWGSRWRARTRWGSGSTSRRSST